MKLGRVIGRVVCTRKHGEPRGPEAPARSAGGRAAGRTRAAALVAFDTARAGEGDLVFFESGKEAAQANPNGWFNPADAAIIGIVDAVHAGHARQGAAS